jgi:NADPH:quinone reductase-like Zn-dependent oxidoreductase
MDARRIVFTKPDARYPRMPFYPGYSFAGVVEAVGSAVSTVTPGDRVLGTMGHQDLVVVDAERGKLDRIPGGVSFEQEGRLHTEGLVSHRGTPDEVLPMWEALKTHPAEHLGVIIVWSGDTASAVGAVGAVGTA